MKVTHISVNEHSTLEGVRTVHVAAEFQPGEAIEASDIAAIEGLMMEAAGGKAKAPAEEKPAGRRRGKKAEAEAEAPAEEKPARRRRGKAAEEAEAPAEEKPARRRRSAKKDDGIKDADLVKACSEAASQIGPDLVAEILEDDYKVTEVSELNQDQRKEFLETLRKEIEAE